MSVGGAIPPSASHFFKTTIMELNLDQIESAFKILKDADGEDIQRVIKWLGKEDQILKQLVMGASDLDLKNCIQEREELIKKPFWDNVIDGEYNMKYIAQKVWNDLHNNDALIYNDFESYWKSI
jgi:hypothetical protein